MSPELSHRRRGARDLAEMVLLWLILLGVDIRLRLLPFSWNRAWLFRCNQPGDVQKPISPDPLTVLKIRKLIRLLRSSARFRLSSRTPCLCLSLALRHRLRVMGIDSAIVYGTRKNPRSASGMDAHAWLRIGELDMDPASAMHADFNEFTAIVP